MKTYDHVEDYLEVLAGKRDLVTGKVNSSYLFGAFSPIVNLARYDTSFLDDLTTSTLNSTAMTDRQAMLACKIILKYQRQLSAKGIDVTPCVTPRYRRPLRFLDRSKRIYSDGTTIFMKFPYDSNMISQLRELLKARQGSAHFNKETKTWEIAVSEFNANFAVTWAKGHRFEVSSELEHYLQEIIDVESVPYKIELKRSNTGLVIDNAPASMIDYLHSRGISIDENNLFQLVDLSSVLGYTVHEDLVSELDSSVGPDLVVFMLHRDYELAGDHEQITRLYRYAQLVNRLPMVVYAPMMDNSLKKCLSNLGEDLVVELNNIKINSLSEITKPILLTHKPLAIGDSIPLTVSNMGLLAGVEKQLMQQNSEKIVYFNRKLGS